MIPILANFELNLTNSPTNVMPHCCCNFPSMAQGQEAGLLTAASLRVAPSQTLMHCIRIGLILMHASPIALTDIHLSIVSSPSRCSTLQE